MNSRALLISAGLAGLLSGVLSSVPVISAVNCLLCAWLWLGGIFAVWLYRRNAASPVDLGRGAVIGLLAGLVGAIVTAIISLIIGPGTTATLPPETMAQLEEQLGESARVLTNPATALTVGIILDLILFPLFGAIGGLIGSAVFKNRPV